MTSVEKMSGSLVARTARELVQPSIVGSVTSVDRVLRTIEDTAKTVRSKL